jgi:hypothetical protein
MKFPTHSQNPRAWVDQGLTQDQEMDLVHDRHARDVGDMENQGQGPAPGADIILDILDPGHEVGGQDPGHEVGDQDHEVGGQDQGREVGGQDLDHVIIDLALSND